MQTPRDGLSFTLLDIPNLRQLRLALRRGDGDPLTFEDPAWEGCLSELFRKF